MINTTKFFNKDPLSLIDKIKYSSECYSVIVGTPFGSINKKRKTGLCIFSSLFVQKTVGNNDRSSRYLRCFFVFLNSNIGIRDKLIPKLNKIFLISAILLSCRIRNGLESTYFFWQLRNCWIVCCREVHETDF